MIALSRKASPPARLPLSSRRKRPNSSGDAIVRFDPLVNRSGRSRFRKYVRSVLSGFPAQSPVCSLDAARVQIRDVSALPALATEFPAASRVPPAPALRVPVSAYNIVASGQRRDLPTLAILLGHEGEDLLRDARFFRTSTWMAPQLVASVAGRSFACGMQIRASIMISAAIR